MATPPARYFPTMHAFTAVQAVLCPVLNLYDTRFPPDPLTIDLLRRLWESKIDQLVALNFPPLLHRGALEKAKLCPHKLFAPDDRDGVPCELPGCPFCWGLRAALKFENVLRTQERYPAAHFWFLRSRGRELPTVPGELGRIEYRQKYWTWVLLAGTATRARAWGWKVRPVPRNALGLARAVSWLLPYHHKLLTASAEDVFTLLSEQGRKHRTHTTGIFRSPLSARQIGQCRRNLIAPKVDPIFQESFPLVHDAETLVHLLPSSFDHEGFGRQALEARLKGKPYRLTWGGLFTFPFMNEFMASPNKTLGALLRVWKPGDDGIFILVPKLGYLAIRRRLDEVDWRLFGMPPPPNSVFPTGLGILGARLTFRWYKKDYVCEPLRVWAERWRRAPTSPGGGAATDSPAA